MKNLNDIKDYVKRRSNDDRKRLLNTKDLRWRRELMKCNFNTHLQEAVDSFAEEVLVNKELTTLFREMLVNKEFSNIDDNLSSHATHCYTVEGEVWQ